MIHVLFLKTQITIQFRTCGIHEPYFSFVWCRAIEVLPLLRRKFIYICLNGIFLSNMDKKKKNK